MLPCPPHTIGRCMCCKNTIMDHLKALPRVFYSIHTLALVLFTPNMIVDARASSHRRFGVVHHPFCLNLDRTFLGMTPLDSRHDRITRGGGVVPPLEMSYTGLALLFHSHYRTTHSTFKTTRMQQLSAGEYSHLTSNVTL